MDETPRTARKRQAIMTAATDAFLTSGYLGTSMDQIAAAAAVSKQTVYKQFSDKEQLFIGIVLDTMGRAVDDMVRGATEALKESDDLERDLVALARNLITSIWRPDVLRLRRLVVGEAGRFPQIGAAYFTQGFLGGLRSLADSLATLDGNGRLRIDDPMLAAQHFAGLVLWVPMNRAMFTGADDPLPPSEVDHFSAAGVRAFLAAYGG